MELKKTPSFSNKRPILITQKTNIKFDLDLSSVTSNDTKTRVSLNPPKIEKSGSRIFKDNVNKTESKNDYNVPQATIEQFLEKSMPDVRHITHQDSAITRARVIEEMYRINQRAVISTEERQQLYQIAVTMDAPKLARKLVIDAKELHLESLEGFSFLTGNAAESARECGSDSDERRVAEEDERFCKAFDEVERIRLRIIQRASSNNPEPTTLPSIHAPASDDRNRFSSNAVVRTYSLQKLAESEALQRAEASITSPKSMRLGSGNSSVSPKFTQQRFFEKPFLQRNDSKDKKQHVSVDRITSDIDSLIDSRPSSGRRSRPNSGRKSSRECGNDIDTRVNQFDDPFLRLPRNLDQRSREEESLNIQAAQEELHKVHSSVNRIDSDSHPKYGGFTPATRHRDRGSKESFRRVNDEMSDSDEESHAKIAAQPLQARRLSRPHPADLNISVSYSRDLLAEEYTPSSLQQVKPPPSTHRGSGGTPASVTGSSSGRSHLTSAKLQLLSSPMSDWLHIGKSLSEDEGSNDGERSAVRAASSKAYAAAASGAHPTIYEDDAARQTGPLRQSHKFSFESAAPSPTVAGDTFSKKHTRNNASGPNSDSSRYAPSPGGSSLESNVGVLKAYTDQRVVDSVRKALVNLNGVMTTSGEIEDDRRSNGVSQSENHTGGRSRRPSKDAHSLSTLSQTLGVSGQASLPFGRLKTSHSSSAILPRDPDGGEVTGIGVEQRSGRPAPRHMHSAPEHSDAESNEMHAKAGVVLGQSQSASEISHKSTRLSALAAALDAGDAVGRLMAEMLVSKK